MTRLARKIAVPVGALTLAVALAAGMSAGPAFADEPAAPATPVVEVAPTDTTPDSGGPSDPVPPSETPTPPTESSAPAADQDDTAKPAPASSTAPPVQTDPPAASGQPAPAPVVPPKDTEQRLPDLRVSLALDKPVYDAHDTIGVGLTVTNAGPGTATDVWVDTMWGNVDIGWWDSLNPPGVRLEPGERAEVTRPGSLRSLDADQLARIGVTVRSAEPDLNPADNSAETTAAVTVVRGDVTGVLYADRNGNAAMDPGEPWSDVDIEISGGVPSGYYSQRTDQQGRFAFRDLPAGTYQFLSFSIDGWATAVPLVTVDGTHDPDVVIRATRPVSESLTVALAFTRNAYTVGETAHLLVRLTNRGAVPIPGLTAWSETEGQWGALSAGGPGVTVPASSTVEVDVSIPIPPDAPGRGGVNVVCYIGDGISGSVQASAFARVPGVVVPRVVGRLKAIGLPQVTIMGDPGFPLPDTRVYLRDPVSRAVVARAGSDANGQFVFTNVPAGRYDLGIVGPWKILSMYPYPTPYNGVWVMADLPDIGLFYLSPGPEQPDPEPAPEPGTPPPAQGGVTPAQAVDVDQTGLAYTGANVVWLAIGGLLALATGIGLVLRRRTPLA